ncbi:hypothetical protein Nepgr_012192 [Nepenthes gracilis]|uniref:Ycf20-like protein n=1 Tax=Nepenthes gracilis TaxID=150966 RepID=A0AAD3XN27_NEPGR|nr:hypothetical protein Nepgr_012192 [Nepenthes gracilis]
MAVAFRVCDIVFKQGADSESNTDAGAGKRERQREREKEMGLGSVSFRALISVPFSDRVDFQSRCFLHQLHGSSHVSSLSNGTGLNSEGCGRLISLGLVQLPCATFHLIQFATLPYTALADVILVACRMGATIIQSMPLILDKESYGKSYVFLSTAFTLPSPQRIFCVSATFSNLCMKSLCFSSKNKVQERRHGWKVAFALDTGRIPDNGDQESIDGDGPGLGQTRLSRIVSAGGRQLLGKLNSARKNFPMKIFLLLLGFYTANALATILGQTGDWDVLVAGVIVTAIEGVGMLMYRRPPPLPKQRLQSLVVMINYWKAGVCLGLFVDAFKLGS